MMRGEWRASGLLPSRTVRGAAEKDMFSSCRVVNGLSRDVFRTPTHHHQLGLEVQTLAHMANVGNHWTYSTYQEKASSSSSSSSSSNDGMQRSVALVGISSLTKPPALVPPPLATPAGMVPKLGQEGLKKVCRSEEDGPCPFPGLPSGVLEMRVKEGSKIRNLMGFAMARVQGCRGEQQQEGGSGGLRQVVFSGSGRAVTKTITCAEIMKRKVGDLHQLTKLRYKMVREVWESTGGGGAGGVGGAGAASGTTVHRTVPSISILLSKDPLDPQEPGYQPPEALLTLWGEGDEGGGGKGGAGRSTFLHAASAKRQPGSGHELAYAGGSPPCWKKACLGNGVSPAAGSD